MNPMAAEAAALSTYEQLKDTDFVQRLKSNGASDSQIKRFLDEIDEEIALEDNITESNFDRIMYETLKEVVTRPINAMVYRAMLKGFSEEISYTLENHELHSNMLPLRDAVKGIVLGKESDTDPIEETEIKKDELRYALARAQELYDSAVIGINPGQYPIASKTALYNAITVAKASLNKEGAAQSEIDGAMQLLQTAINDFEKSKIKEQETLKNPTSPGNTSSGGSGQASKPSTVETPKPQEQISIKIADIAGHWAESDITYLVGKGAVTGYPDGSFKPNNNITRCEFISILVKALKLETKTGKVFKDTEKHWAKDLISTAYANGITNGYGNDLFGPNDLITREQMVVMIVKAAGLNLKVEGRVFADNQEISSWAKDAVNIALGHNIVSGRPNNKFEPKSMANRAEAVTIIVNMLKALE